MNIKVLCIISAVLLLLAIPTGWPYDYYILLRWFICFSSLVVSHGFYKSKLQGWSLVFGLNAILFNPVFPIKLQKNTWVLIDLLAAFLFFISAYSTRKKKQ